ncbi:hypothetical protein CDIK_1684 [Cucumispora dikerogammari]|nr:hypothetical protein CDIK_1684 [Cucumispora dikerogammari]
MKENQKTTNNEDMQINQPNNENIETNQPNNENNENIETNQPNNENIEINQPNNENNENIETNQGNQGNQENQENNSDSEEKLNALLNNSNNQNTTNVILSNTVIIKNVKKSINQKDLIKHFISCGKIKSIDFDRKNNMASIEFENIKSVKLAMKFSKTIIKKCKIIVFKKKNVKGIRKE